MNSIENQPLRKNEESVSNVTTYREIKYQQNLRQVYSGRKKKTSVTSTTYVQLRHNLGVHINYAVEDVAIRQDGVVGYNTVPVRDEYRVSVVSLGVSGDWQSP